MIDNTQIELLYSKYSAEMRYLNGVNPLNIKEFEKYLGDNTRDLKQLCLRDGDNVKGILLYRLWDDGETLHCLIPEFGYYADSVKTLSELFETLANDLSHNSDKLEGCEFLVHLYAHDRESLELFHMMQFGNICETGIARIEKEAEFKTDFDIKALDKAHLSRHWHEVWGLTNAIITRLKSSPVFYSGEEFTEEVYRDFYSDDETEVIAAFEDGKIIGIIEWNTEPCEFVCGTYNSVNVGEAYVIPEKRGSGLARAMLEFAKHRASERGAEYMWVQHGTANPNARGFWNKYFQTYRYELIRTVRFINVQKSP